ncbi:MAG: virulence RhuM family protein [Chloroflexi bacterium]|nr:virulence RhuM family protein [Chloroflexota bacterium]
MNDNQILLYETEDGETRVEVLHHDETLWLSQRDLAELFKVTPQNIGIHIKNIYESGELYPDPTRKDYLRVQNEGGRQVSREIAHYNLDMIISVGYRVNSIRGTQFRIWATQKLREFIVKPTFKPRIRDHIVATPQPTHATSYPSPRPTNLRPRDEKSPSPFMGEGFGLRVSKPRTYSRPFTPHLCYPDLNTPT